MTPLYFVYFLLAYLLGSIPSGFLIARVVKGIDIRQHGSQSTGATNVFRTVGKKWGILVMLLDAMKGYLAVMLPKFIPFESTSSHFAAYLGLIAILAHSFPVWLKFKGGKGVATSLGVFLGLAFIPTMITFALFWLVFAISRILSLASLSAAAAFPLVILLIYRKDESFIWLFPISLLLMIFIFFTHRANIGRLLRGEENKLI